MRTDWSGSVLKFEQPVPYLSTLLWYSTATFGSSDASYFPPDKLIESLANHRHVKNNLWASGQIKNPSDPTGLQYKTPASYKQLLDQANP